MSNIITLKNGNAVCKISTLGAELISYVVDGKEKIWQGGEGFWAGKSPILFPVCGRILDGFYLYKGNRYELKAHGFVRNSEFSVVNEETSTATFLLENSDELKALYPFDFKFRVMYKLSETSLKIYFAIENHSEEEMPYSVGCHEGYALEGDLSEYTLSFEEDENVILNTITKNNYTSPDKKEIKLDKNELNLSSYFTKDNDGDSLIVEDIKSKRVTLKRNGEDCLSVYFNDFKHLVLWTQYGAKFLAIEPWNGLPDAFDTNHELSTKLSIEKLPSKSTKTVYHSITVY